MLVLLCSKEEAAVDVIMQLPGRWGAAWGSRQEPGAQQGQLTGTWGAAGTAARDLGRGREHHLNISKRN